jgi:hypothetical protein
MNYQQKQQERHEKMDYRQPHYKPGRNRRRASYAISKAHSALYRKHTKPTKHFWITHINHHRATKKGKRGKGRKIRYRTPISNFRAHLSSSNAAYLDQTWRKGRKIKRGIQEAIAFYVFRCRWRERRRWTGFLLYVSHECCCFCLQENNRRCLRAYVFGLDWTCIIKATFNPMEIDFFFFCSNWRERKLSFELKIDNWIGTWKKLQKYKGKVVSDFVFLNERFKLSLKLSSRFSNKDQYIMSWQVYSQTEWRETALFHKGNNEIIRHFFDWLELEP